MVTVKLIYIDKTVIQKQFNSIKAALDWIHSEGDGIEKVIWL